MMNFSKTVVWLVTTIVALNLIPVSPRRLDLRQKWGIFLMPLIFFSAAKVGDHPEG
jgi:hypothetical protein